jgi:hypothetical protein
MAQPDSVLIQVEPDLGYDALSALKRKGRRDRGVAASFAAGAAQKTARPRPLALRATTRHAAQPLDGAVSIGGKQAMGQIVGNV